MDLVQLLFGFQGRINRANYWLAVGIWLAISIIMWLLIFVVLAVAGSWILASLIGLILLVPAIWSGIAVGIKRLHDRDKSGWWLLFFYVVPGLLQAVGSNLGAFGLILVLAALAIDVWMIVELGCLRGTEGSNQYGPDPLASMARQPA